MVRDSVRLRALLGYLPGDLALYDRMKGRDLLAFIGHMRGGVPAAAYETLAERFQVDLDRRIKDLSRGNRQKIGVIQAFMHHPQLLILDEPTSGLDPAVQQEFQHRVVRETVEAGATVFLSSHVLAEVELMADRVGHRRPRSTGGGRQRGHAARARSTAATGLPRRCLRIFPAHPASSGSRPAAPPPHAG
ncbi:MAG: ABC transporter ATP-binding protein [Candidatus Nanopelagicales bacterium]